MADSLNPARTNQKRLSPSQPGTAGVARTLNVFGDWINPAYLRASTIQEARAAFAASRPLSHLQAKNFLRQDQVDRIISLLDLSEYENSYVPNQHSYALMSSRKSKRALARFNDLRQFCRSIPFRTVLGLLTGLDIRTSQFIPVKFDHRDYTVLHDTEKLKPGVDVFLDFSDDLPNACGGDIVYLTKAKELIRVSPCRNALTIIARPHGVMRYVKYLNHKAGRAKSQTMWLGGW